ncbi:Mycobacterium rhizamassiliense ORFan [Mycobacterium rhizamassiliense]|uniref:Mycobacterium rhizamassiliense ORFan n=1 Tax=Mycobacterium rhizamassiliense TaxID=1841860 RepID=A0A2U3NVU2_9MYCO|nr:Mycobacterium rhizamassiliense ORFan [Mycobacterium rhizamassiliense]
METHSDRVRIRALDDEVASLDDGCYWQNEPYAIRIAHLKFVSEVGRFLRGRSTRDFYEVAKY